MFQKKQYIYSEAQGVCRVENIVQLKSANGKEIMYYVLRPVFDSGKVSYIPVHNHQVVLKELFTEEEAKQLQNSELAKKDYKIQDAIDFVLQRKEDKADAVKKPKH